MSPSLASLIAQAPTADFLRACEQLLGQNAADSNAVAQARQDLTAAMDALAVNPGADDDALIARLRGLLALLQPRQVSFEDQVRWILLKEKSLKI